MIYFSRNHAARFIKTASLFAALTLAASCKAPAVTGFEWKDSSGKAILFSQASAWPEGEEGRFGPKRTTNRYIPAQALTIDPEEAIEVLVTRRGNKGSEQGDSVRINLSLSSKVDGSLPLATASFPLLENKAKLIIGIDTRSLIASLSVSAVGSGSIFEISSIETVQSFRGIEGQKEAIRVSSGFTMALQGANREMTITRPFAGAEASERKPGDPQRGILIEYGKAPKTSVIRIDVRLKDGSERAFRLRSHPAGMRTVLDESIVPEDAEQITLWSTTDLEISTFYAASLKGADYRLADLGRIMRDEGPVNDFSLYRWDMIPSVMALDFKDYATQDKYLKRLAFFVEKAGYRGVLAKDEDIAALHGYNAHDYRAEDLAAFYQAAREKAFSLGAEEKELESLLIEAGTLKLSGGKIRAGTGALISVARESGEALRWTLLTHESMHAIFFTDPDYRSFVRSLWASVGSEERWFWKTYLGWAAYDVGSEYLMSNEFQAYLLQQPAAMAEEYFSKRKAEELLEKHGELRPRVEEYMSKYGKSFAERAKQLEEWLYGKYGVEAGRTVFLTQARP